MTSAPDVRFARSDGISIAYTRWGDGRPVVFTPSLVTNVELCWELHEWARTLRRAGEVHDVLMVDKRGTGLSERGSHLGSFAELAGDIVAVLDAEGIERAGVVGFSEGGLVALALAALHPDRVDRMVVMGVPAMGAPREQLVELSDREDPYPTDEEIAGRFRRLIRTWATPEPAGLELTAPGAVGNERIRSWWQRWERQTASPGTIRAHFQSHAGSDVLPYLSSIQAPTLVAHARRDGLVHVANGRLLGQLIPGATYWEVDCDAHQWFLNEDKWEEIQDRIDAFVIGVPSPPSRSMRHLATVLFTDIVDSTRTATAIGDGAWRRLVELHDSVSERVIANHGGRVVKSTGDGSLALFTDPGAAVAAAVELRAQLAGIVEIRAGAHTGHLVVRGNGDVSGIAVNVAARVEACAEPGRIYVSQTVRDLLLGGSERFVDRGERQLKGVDGSWRLYEVDRTS